jgi:hypothetical protein
MIKDIHYNGFSAVPSDYAAPDGDLAAAINIINDDGTLKPMLPPAKVFTAIANSSYFIHNVNGKRLYVWYKIADGKLLFGCHPDESELFNISLQDGETICDIAAMRYFIILSTNKNLHYFRYDASKETYRYLGTHLPDIQLQFGLVCKFAMQEYSSDNITVVSSSDTKLGTSEDWDLVLSFKQSLSESNFTKSAGAKYILYTSLSYKLNLETLSKGVAHKFTWNKPTNQINGITTRIVVQGLYSGDTDYTDLWTCEAGWFDNDTFDFEITPTKDITAVRVRLEVVVPENMSLAYPIALSVAFYNGLDSSATTDGTTEYYIKYDNNSFNACKAALNKFINEEATSKDFFLYPFLVRYAIVMYNGEIGYVSAPALMLPNSGYVPAMSYDSNGKLTTAAFVGSLRGIIGKAIPDEWRELISSIDIYVSSPLWTYNQGEEFDTLNNLYRFSKTTDSLTYSHAYYGTKPNNSDLYFDTYQLSSYLKDYTSAFSGEGFIRVSEMTFDKWKKQIDDISAFYKVASIGVDGLAEKNELFDIELNEGCLSSLVACTTLTDEPLQYASYQGSHLYVYNNRLDITPTNVGLPTPAQLYSCNSLRGSAPNNSETGRLCAVTVYVRSSYGERQVKSIVDESTIQRAYNHWFYYPDSNAYKVKFEIWNAAVGLMQSATFDLTAHDFLTGAYLIGGGIGAALSLALSTNEEAPSDIAEELTVRPCNSTLYYSETNNPFCFSSSVQIGQGTILGICSAAKALSQGQFGQFPLYAFTDEGVWALEVSSTGGFTAKQPITRDVVLGSGGSITQIDSAVLFATDRGIMLLSDSNSECITDSLDNRTTLSVADMPSGNAILELAGLSANDTKIEPFKEFIKDCQMLYDYVNQRIIVFNTGRPYAYVYSMKTKLWGMMQSSIATAINSYPDALAMDSSSNLVDFGASDAISASGLLVTRPIKLDAPDALKTIDTIIQRGVFAKGHVQQILQGSRDCISWFNVFSSQDQYLRGFRGTPYKYFRLVLLCTLDANEYLYGCTVQYTPRLTGRPR